MFIFCSGILVGLYLGCLLTLLIKGGDMREK